MLALAAPAWAGPDATRDSLDRLGEVLELRIDEGRLDPAAVTPLLVVSTQPRYVASETWFGARSLEVLQRAFGEGSLRLCEACMAPRAWVEDGRMVYHTGPVDLNELARLDAGFRGASEPAKAAVWIDEHRGGIGVRIVDLATSNVLFAQNIDPTFTEGKNTERIYTMSEELERRARGDSVTQAFVDFALYPGQHLSLDWTDQWGPRNSSLSGVTVSLFDPILGIGAVHYQRIDVLNILVGGKGIISIPTALVAAIDDGGGAEVIDPLLTAVGVVRVPFGRSNYGAILTASTNGEIGVGVSLMNLRLLPVIP